MAHSGVIAVSVLFSEPKIPQCLSQLVVLRRVLSFSALQRAENSSIQITSHITPARRRFQCSSASRKFLNRVCLPQSRDCGRGGFSALQRAENSSINPVRATPARCLRFQCSSASRKFLNHFAAYNQTLRCNGFSALQRAENSSIRR